MEPYLIREQYNNYEKSNYTFRINNLKKALLVDSLEPRVNYLLGKLYYELFNREFTKNLKNANTDKYAKNAYHYFVLLYNSPEKSYKEILKFPLIQLSGYLGKLSDKKIFESSHIQVSWFPVSAFLSLPKNWETNYTVDVLNYISGYGKDFECRGVEYALFRINGYSSHLSALEEPALMKDSTSFDIIRFTYLRSFDNPVVIGLENKKGLVKIYWKVSDGAGGYEPGKIIENKSKQLSIKEWQMILKEVVETKLWELPTVNESFSGLDGSQWILEIRVAGRYHVIDRWCGSEIGKICRSLLALTDLKLDKMY